MIDTAIKCIELIQKIVKIREEVADNVAHYLRLCSRAMTFEAILQDYKQPAAAQHSPNKRAVQASLNALHATLDEISQLADRFPKKTLLGQVKHVIFRNHYADEIADLNTQLSQCASDLHVALSQSHEARRLEDQEDLCRYLASSVDKVVQEIRMHQSDLAASQVAGIKEASRQAAEEDFQHLKADLLRCIEEISKGSEGSIVKALEAEGEKLMVQIDSKHAGVLGALQEIQEGVQAVHEDVRGMREEMRKMRVLLEVAHEASEDNKGVGAAGRGEKQAMKSEILSRLNKTHSGSLEVLERCKLGQGTFGEVFLGLFNGSKVAAKRVQEYEAEVIIMDIVKGHPKILPCYGYVLDEKCSHVLLELMPFGSLSSMLYDKARFRVLPASLLLAWGCDMADALCHIHSLKVKHRDIKAENFLLSADLQLKLCDFGTAKRQETTVHTKGPVGTFVFMAPEVFAKKGTDLSSDIFSWAITMVQVLIRAVPDGHKAAKELISVGLAALSKLTASTAVLPRLGDLLQSCVYYDETAMNSSSLRPAATEVFSRMTQILREAGGDPRSRHSCSEPVLAEYIKVLRATAQSLWETKERGEETTTDADGMHSSTLRSGWSSPVRAGEGSTTKTASSSR